MYAGTDPVTRRRVYLRETAKDLTRAQITLGRLLEQALAGTGWYLGHRELKAKSTLTSRS